MNMQFSQTKRQFQLYIQEIEKQIRFAMVCYDQYLHERDKDDVEIIFLHLHHLLVHVAAIDRLLNKINNSKSNLLADLGNQIIGIDQNKLKSFKRARNHLEHFEERLEIWQYLYPCSPIFDMNIANSNTKGLPEEQCLRLLRIDKNQLIILGEKFDLIEIHDLLIELKNRISVWGSHKADFKNKV